MAEYTMHCPVCGETAEVIDKERWYVEQDNYFGYEVFCPTCHSKSRVELCQSATQDSEIVNNLINDLKKSFQETCGSCLFYGSSGCNLTIGSCRRRPLLKDYK